MGYTEMGKGKNVQELRIANRLRWATLQGVLYSYYFKLRIANRLRWATLRVVFSLHHIELRIANRLRWATLYALHDARATSCGLLTG